MANPTLRLARPRSVKWRLIESLHQDHRDAEDEEVRVAIGELITDLKRRKQGPLPQWATWLARTKGIM